MIVLALCPYFVFRCRQPVYWHITLSYSRDFNIDNKQTGICGFFFVKTAAGKLEKLNERAMRCIFNDNDELLVKASMPSLQNRRI